MVTLLNVPKLDLGHTQSARTSFGYMFQKSQYFLWNTYYSFAHLKIRGQCSDLVPHHMLKLGFVPSFYHKPDLRFKLLKQSPATREREDQAEGPRLVLSTLAAGTATKQNMTGDNTEIQFLCCQSLQGLSSTSCRDPNTDFLLLFFLSDFLVQKIGKKQL